MPDMVYRSNPAGWKAIANSPGVVAALRAVAEKAKVHAEALAEPFRSDDDSEEHKHYADSFEVRDETVQWTGEHPGPRAAARLQNTAPHAAAVEYGYAGRADAPNENSAHRVLGRTLNFLEGETR